MKINVMRGPGGFKDGVANVTGKAPKHEPYIWIGDELGCLAVINQRKMNTLCNQWARANTRVQATASPKASRRKQKSSPARRA